MPSQLYMAGCDPHWPNRSTPSGTSAIPNAAARNARCCGAASWAVTSGLPTSSGVTIARQGPGPEVPEHEVGRRHVHDRRADALLGQQVARAHASGSSAPQLAITQRHRSSPSGASARPVGAGQHAGPHRVALLPREQVGERLLADRRGREPQVRRLAVLAVAEVADRVEQDPLRLEREARLVEARGRAARRRSTGVIADWCAPPSRDSDTPDGVPANTNFAPE